VDIERYLSVDLAADSPVFDAALAELSEMRAIERMWAHDPTLWKPRPEDDVELSSRLGWLTLPNDYLQLESEHLPELEQYATAAAREGISHVVVCGMGGSSLAPEVFRITFEAAKGHPQLIVVDSTDPTFIRTVDARIDPDRTLFLISSKSGGTLEVMSFLAHFWATTGGNSQHFFAITDPGTSLERLARERNFRHVFLNPTEIGGRYSALSLFGLAPVALSGVDVRRLLSEAAHERELCSPDRPPERNSGAYLGAFMGGLARSRRDKLTLLTSPGLSSFGLWAEQLIAESTGKEGVGVVPVVGEPFGTPDVYDKDRCFVALRLVGDDNAELDRTVESLRGKHPIVVRSLQNRYQLGAEMYCWEVATALAGALLHINPFDQPNVQESKDNTSRVLQMGLDNARPSDDVILAPGDLPRFLKQAEPGDYVAIQAYLTPIDEVEARLQQLRAGVRNTRRVATTLGFGPRFLHSTGQLHKGGPRSGVFVQLTYQPVDDLDIPGQPFTFGTLFAAQSLGDLLSLHERGLRVARIDLGPNPLEGLDWAVLSRD
jgi:glucose-6-phosphate isomerase/transaldolase/glucose-6-phosphate isomerase